jgi:hypothetical protein
LTQKPYVVVLSKAWNREQYDSLLPRLVRLSEGALQSNDETRRGGHAVISGRLGTLELLLDPEEGVVLRAQAGRSEALARRVVQDVMAEVEREKAIRG